MHPWGPSLVGVTARVLVSQGQVEMNAGSNSFVALEAVVVRSFKQFLVVFRLEGREQQTSTCLRSV